MTVSATVIPGEVIASGYGLLAGAVLALAVALTRIRERLARLEQWMADRD